MPTVEELTDPHVASYTPPPHAGVGVCDVCHNAPFVGQARCWSCGQTTSTVSHPLTLVVPISLYEVGGQLHTVLSGYKRSSDARARRLHRLQVAALLHRFVRDHGDHVRAVAGDDWDIVTIVPSKPSTQPRAGPHPLEQVISLGRTLRAQYESLLEPLDPDTITRARASDTGFRAVRPLDGVRVLLIDDTFTSGSTFQSAASALTLGGGQVVAGVVIGRVIHPTFTAEMGELWGRQRKAGFDFDVCCLDPP